MKIAAVLFFIVLGGQAIALAFGIDSWPLTNYPMFAENKKLSEAVAYRLKAIGCPDDIEIGNTGRPNWEPYQNAFTQHDWPRMKELAMAEAQREVGHCQHIQIFRSSLKEPFQLGEIDTKKIIEVDVTTGQIHVESNL